MRRIKLSTPIVFLLVLFQGCGGGSNTTIVAPSNLVYPQTSIAGTVGAAIATDAPTVTGTVDSYNVSPALPAGLSLNTSTGVISGTPTAASSQTTYTVVAANSAGSTSTKIQLTVVSNIPAPSQLVYPQSTISASVGVAILSDIPTVTGTVDAFSVMPALPSGLSLNGSTGMIAGTPSAQSASATYTITATNAGGSTTANVTVGVNKGLNALLELGHSANVNLLQLQNSRLLSRDDTGHWVLWDYASGSILARGDQVPNTAHYPMTLAGNTLVVGIPNGLEVRSSIDGHVLSTIISQNSWWKLATDGSYICAASSSGLSTWSPDGTLLFFRAGDYSAANTFASPDAIRVALGPAGQNVVETISIPSGTSSAGPAFSGQFNSWFLDGARFLTNQGNTIWTYSNTGVQQAIVSLSTIENLTGQGNWIWTFQNSPYWPLNIYAIGSSSPAVTYTLTPEPLGNELVIPSGTTIGAMPSGPGQISIIDLSGSSPVKVDYSLPVVYESAYAAASPSQWIVGNRHGVVLDGASLSGTPRFIALGQAWTIAGGTSRAAIGVASGSIFYLDPSGPKLEGTIPFSSSKLQLSSDGTVLAAMANAHDAQYEPDRTLKVFSLPTESLINSWPYTLPQGACVPSCNIPYPTDFSLSGSGTMIGQVLFTLTSGSFQRMVGSTTGGSSVWSDTPIPAFTNGTDIPIGLSPDGSLIGVSDSQPSPSSITNIYNAGLLVTAVPGWAAGWIDNGRLLVNNYVLGPSSNVQYSGATIYDPTGAKLSSPGVPELLQFQSVTSDWIYSPSLNTIFSLSSGSSVWTSSSPTLGVGAVSGNYVVFASGSQVLVDSY